jgi:hypothetical protein
MAIASLLTLTLTACSNAPEKLPVIKYVGEPMPAMPERYSRVIPDPGGAVRGRDVRITAKQNREWGKMLRDQHAQIVAWYKRVRAAQLAGRK